MSNSITETVFLDKNVEKHKGKLTTRDKIIKTPYGGIRLLTGDLVRDQGRVIGLFALIIIICGNFLSELIPWKVQDIMKTNIYIKHVFAFLTLFFFVYLTMPDVEAEGVGITFSIYLLFLFSKKLSPNIWFTLIFLITILYLFELAEVKWSDYIKDNRKDAKELTNRIKFIDDWIRPTVFITILGLSIYGFGLIILNYFETPYKKRPLPLHFLFGELRDTK